MKKIILFSILIMAMLINSRSNGLDLNYSDKNEKSLFGGLFSTNIGNLLNECIAKFKMSMEKINSELEKINSQNYTNFELASVIYPNENDTSFHFSMGGCSCVNQQCKCCSHIEVDQLQINKTGSLVWHVVGLLPNFI